MTLASVTAIANRDSVYGRRGERPSRPALSEPESAESASSSSEAVSNEDPTPVEQQLAAKMAEAHRRAAEKAAPKQQQEADLIDLDEDETKADPDQSTGGAAGASEASHL